MEPNKPNGLKLFYDCETSDKWNFNAPNNDECQPYPVQIGASLMSGPDKELASVNLIIKPDGWFISDETTKIHGISQEMAEQCGIPMIVALAVFTQLSRLANERVAFNVDFDERIIGRGMAHIQKEDSSAAIPSFCVMKSMAPICKIEKPEYQRRYNRNDPWKWPKLEEAYQFAFHRDFDGAHNAMADVQATAKLYWWMHTMPDQKEMLI